MPYTDILYSVGCLARLGAAAGNNRGGGLRVWSEISKRGNRYLRKLRASCYIQRPHI